MTTTKPKMSVAELARKSGVDRGNLWTAIEGRRGFSMPVAKAVAPVFGTDAIALYVMSQAKSLEKKDEAGDTPAVLRGIASIVGELRKQSEEDLAAGGADLVTAMLQLHALLLRAQATALTFAKPANTADAAETTTLSDQILRDAFGSVQRHQKVTKAARDAFGMRGTNGTGAERDGYGRKTS